MFASCAHLLFLSGGTPDRSTAPRESLSEINIKKKN